MTHARLLIVHPEPSALAMLASMLRSLGHELIEATSDRDALRMLPGRPGLILIGVDPATPVALDLLFDIRRKSPETPVILLVPSTCPERISLALRLGAISVLRFPLPANQLRAAVVQALDAAGAHRTPVEGPHYEPDAPRLPGRQPALPEPVSKRIGDASSSSSPSPISSPCPARPVEARTGEAVPAPIDSGSPIRPLKEALGISEREFILQALRACKWNRHQTAEALEINRTTLYKKMKRYGLPDEEGGRRGTGSARSRAPMHHPGPVAT